MEMQSLNIPADTLKLVVIICFAIIGFLVLMVVRMADKRFSVPDTLKHTVEKLDGIVKVIQSQQDALEKLMGEKFEKQEHRLNSHAADIKRIDKKVTEIDTTLKIKK